MIGLDEMLAIGIATAAAAYIGRRFWMWSQGEASGCHSGCGHCSDTQERGDI